MSDCNVANIHADNTNNTEWLTVLSAKNRTESNGHAENTRQGNPGGPSRALGTSQGVPERGKIFRLWAGSAEPHSRPRCPFSTGCVRADVLKESLEKISFFFYRRDGDACADVGDRQYIVTTKARQGKAGLALYSQSPPAALCPTQCLRY